MKPSSIWDGKKLQGSVVFIAKFFASPATIAVLDETFDLIYYFSPIIITIEDLVRFRFTWVFCSWVVVNFFDETEFQSGTNNLFLKNILPSVTFVSDKKKPFQYSLIDVQGVENLLRSFIFCVYNTNCVIYGH